MRSEELKRCVPLFSIIPETDLIRIADSTLTKNVAEQTVIFQEGVEDTSLYILIKGRVEIIKAMGTVDERLLAVREPCSFLGELSLFSEDGTPTASVRALTDLELLVVKQAEINDLLYREPKFAYELIRTLSLRLVEGEDLTIRDLRRKNKQLNDAYQDLRAAQSQLVEIEKYKKELDVARQIQMSMLPRDFLTIPNYTHFTRIEPMAAVGGDFFDVIPLDDHLFGVTIGDVSDHGIPAALFMALTTTLVRAEASAKLEPDKVLGEVNQHLLSMNDAGMFVTLLYGMLDTEQGSFNYCRAGHEYPIIISGEGEEIPCEMKQGQPLGVLSEPILEHSKIVIPPGSVMVLYTDGITNAFNPEEARYGLERFKRSIINSLDKPVQSLGNNLWEDLENFMDSAKHDDDLTLFILKAD